MGRVAKVRIASSLAVLAVACRAAEACTVCYGQTESPWIDAAQMSVVLLLGVTVGVQVCFATFFIRLRRRIKSQPDHPEVG